MINDNFLSPSVREREGVRQRKPFVYTLFSTYSRRRRRRRRRNLINHIQYTMWWNRFPASQRSSGQQTPDSSPVAWSRALTGILTWCARFWWWGKPGSLEETRQSTGTTCNVLFTFHISHIWFSAKIAQKVRSTPYQYLTSFSFISPGFKFRLGQEHANPKQKTVCMNSISKVDRNDWQG